MERKHGRPYCAARDPVMKRGAPDHPKMRRLARRLGLPHMAAVGCMEMLWHWASRYAQDGAIGRYDDDDIADALYWTEPAERDRKSVV